MTKVLSLVLVGLLVATSGAAAAPTYDGDLPLLVDPLFDKVHKQDTVGPEIDPDDPIRITAPDELKEPLIFREVPSLEIEDLHPEEVMTLGR